MLIKSVIECRDVATRHHASYFVNPMVKYRVSGYDIYLNFLLFSAVSPDKCSLPLKIGHRCFLKVSFQTVLFIIISVFTLCELLHWFPNCFAKPQGLMRAPEGSTEKNAVLWGWYVICLYADTCFIDTCNALWIYWPYRAWQDDCGILSNAFDGAHKAVGCFYCEGFWTSKFP
jgi:hypothetical protein